MRARQARRAEHTAALMHTCRERAVPEFMQQQPLSKALSYAKAATDTCDAFGKDRALGSPAGGRGRFAARRAPRSGTPRHRQRAASCAVSGATQRHDSSKPPAELRAGARLAQQEAVQLPPCRRLLRLRAQQAAQSPVTQAAPAAPALARPPDQAAGDRLPLRHYAAGTRARPGHVTRAGTQDKRAAPLRSAGTELTHEWGPQQHAVNPAHLPAGVWPQPRACRAGGGRSGLGEWP